MRQYFRKILCKTLRIFRIHVVSFATNSQVTYPDHSSTTHGHTPPSTVLYRAGDSSSTDSLRSKYGVVY